MTVMETRLCACGCGHPTSPATYTNRKRGLVKGQPARFVQSHTGGYDREAHRRERLRSPAERALARLDTSNPEACWIWPGGTNGVGYGKISATGPGGRENGDRTELYVHRVVYEYLVGPIAEGLTLDHLCRNRLCGNPAHLEPVTHRENNLRGRQARGLA